MSANQGYTSPGIAGSGAIATGLAAVSTTTADTILLARSEASAWRAEEKVVAACAKIEGAEPAGTPSLFGFHVFNPVPRMKLVEVCIPDGAAATREKALAWCAALGKTAVEVPDEAGFVVNRLLFPFLFDAVRMIERTGMEPGAVDTCMKLGAGHPMGPLALLDFVGLDVSEAIGDALYADSEEPTHKPPGLLVEMIGEGKLGRKSGAGFYSYD